MELRELLRIVIDKPVFETGLLLAGPVIRETNWR
jgi:hypothetical protein